jgi:hypothetical protein
MVAEHGLRIYYGKYPPHSGPIGQGYQPPVLEMLCTHRELVVTTTLLYHVYKQLFHHHEFFGVKKSS